MNLNNISIILKDTINPGNIGATCRSMMNFGLRNLIIVAPQCSIGEEAYTLARSAAHVFEKAPTYDSLDQIAPLFDIIIGTSRRGAHRLHMRMSPGLSAEEVIKKFPDKKTAVLFGSEKFGLTNEDLEKCAWYISIPSHHDFPSLNLSHSVSIVGYELFLASGQAGDNVFKEPAPEIKTLALFRHMTAFLDRIGFPERGSRERVHADLKRLISSADLRRTDVNLLHGMMRYVEQKYLGGWLEEV